VEVSVADIDWHRWARANPQLAALPRYSSLVPTGPAATALLSDDGHPSVLRRLREATREERIALLPALVTPLLQQITGLQRQQLDDQHAVDIDSLTGVELRALLQNTLGVSVPAVQLQRNLTVTGLTALLADELDRAPAHTPRPLEGIVTHEFLSSDGLTVYGHLSLPPGPGPHPAVVVCGAGAGGALDDEGRYVHVTEHPPLRAAGFAVFTVDQRGAPGHGADYSARAAMGGLDIDDVVAAARYLADLPDIDAARLNILGTSRGGYSALLAMTRAPSVWHRAVLLMGLYDPTHLVAVERSRPGALLPGGAAIDGNELETYFAAPERQPLTGLTSVTAPLLIVHGDADDVVPLTQAVHLADRAHQLGLPAHLVTVPGLGHDNDYTDDAWAGLWPTITHFLREDPQGPLSPRKGASSCR
jgi:epothilone polyketide synthase D